MLVLTVFRLGSTYFFTDPAITGVPQPTIAQVITLCIVLPVFFFTYTYFVISDYLAGLCTFIFRHYGRNLELFFGSYNVKLIVALLVISIAPIAAIIVALFSYEGDRLQVRDRQRRRRRADGRGDLRLFHHPLAAAADPQPVATPWARSPRAISASACRSPPTTRSASSPASSTTWSSGLRERERFRETFGRYVDESVAATILKREGEGVLAGETREATILFTDIAGFTTIAEHLAPDALVAALNEYLETVLEPIRAHGGVVNTFIGDGLFASFNMPLACESHACAAVRAAIEIQRAVGGRTFGDMGVAFATRIGISTGHVIGGSVGAGRRLTFTLLGDTVNLAARLEQLNKDYGTRILVSNSTREACGDQFVFRDLGSVAVRGRSDAAIVFSVDPHGQG